MKRLALAALSASVAAALPGCKVQQRYPGSEVLVTLAFEATATATDCAFADSQDDLPDGGPPAGCSAGDPAAFCFEGTYSRDPGSGAVYFTLGSQSWPATYDGQFASVEMNAPRQFAECQLNGAGAPQGLCDSVVVVEDLNVAMLSVDQTHAVDSQCPMNPLDGGLPPDAGKPQETAAGLDVLIGCGELSDAVLPDAGCGCGPCAFHYTVAGTRR